MALVTANLDNAIGTLVMNNMEKRNALSEALIAEIITALNEFERQKARVVVLRAPPGAKVWSAGHDISELPQTRRDPLGWSDSLRTLIRALEEFPAPIIGLIEGGVWGGACEVAMACDIMVATSAATFAITPAKLGIPYNVTGLLTFMNAMRLQILKEMAFTAQPITAERAERLGLINHLVPATEIEAFVDTLVRQIIVNSPLSISVMKEELRILASAHSITPRMFERVQGLRRVVYDSHDYQEGIKAFQEKRPPVFTGE